MQSASAWWMDHHSRTNNKIKADLEPPCHCAGEPYKRPHVLEIRGINMDGIAVGLSKGHVVSKRKLAARPSQRKGVRRVKLSRFFLGLLSCLLYRNLGSVLRWSATLSGMSSVALLTKNVSWSFWRWAETNVRSSWQRERCVGSRVFLLSR